MKIRDSGVCLGPLEGLVARPGDCGHDFHVDCLSKWAVRDATCPLCKHHFTFFEEWNEETVVRRDVGDLVIDEIEDDMGPSTDSAIAKRVETAARAAKAKRARERLKIKKTVAPDRAQKVALKSLEKKTAMATSTKSTTRSTPAARTFRSFSLKPKYTSDDLFSSN